MEINDVEKIHSIGHRLKDAKITMRHDIKINVAGGTIEGTRGEMVTAPRWVGQILDENNLGTLESPDMITELKQALSKEKMVGEYQISTLDPHFYIRLKETMRRLDRDDYNHVESIMLQLFRMRRGKLIKLADSIKLNSDLNGKMTVEENAFYNSIYETGIKFEKQIRGNADE